MRRPAAAAWAISGTATVVWLVVVVTFDLTGRVADHWASALTMLFGSFLAGSSPEGGGAVAFPVFTKLLDVPGPVARSFGLSIQAVGMTMAVVAIVINRRPLHQRAAVIGAMASVAGFALAVALFGRRSEVFWPMSIGSPWIKATFSIVLATTSFLMVRHIRAGAHDHGGLRWTGRHDVGIVVVGLLGGGLSAFTGTGANIVVFLFLIVIADVDPRIALPTAITVMAAVSVVGIVVFGWFDGQLDVVVEADRVIAVGDRVTDLPADRNDLLGLWLAAVPVVVWGAPLGSLVATMVKEHQLVAFVAVLAAVEVVTTIVLVPELRSEVSLMLYLAVGLIVLPAVVVGMQRHREALFATQTDTVGAR